MKQLPLVFPPIETYQGMSFVLGVMLAHKNTENFVYNKYIRIRGYDNQDIYRMRLGFEDVMWDEYADDENIDVKYYYTKDLNKHVFIDFLEERIDQECYVCLIQVDEFYLAHTRAYRKVHFLHDIYIYGYDTNDFMVMGYRDEKLQLFRVPKKEIVNAVFKFHIRNRQFCIMRIPENMDVKIDYDEIKREYELYYSGRQKRKDTLVHGIETYAVIIRRLKQYEEAGKFRPVDLRIFRMIWEHKILMVKRMKKLEEKYKSTECTAISEKLETQGGMLFRATMKYNIEPTSKRMCKLIEMLQNMEADDKRAGEIILRCMREDEAMAEIK